LTVFGPLGPGNSDCKQGGNNANESFFHVFVMFGFDACFVTAGFLSQLNTILTILLLFLSNFVVTYAN
jgi:hypothetical protein